MRREPASPSQARRPPPSHLRRGRLDVPAGFPGPILRPERAVPAHERLHVPVNGARSRARSTTTAQTCCRFGLSSRSAAAPPRPSERGIRSITHVEHERIAGAARSSAPSTSCRRRHPYIPADATYTRPLTRRLSGSVRGLVRWHFSCMYRSAIAAFRSAISRDSSTSFRTCPHTESPLMLRAPPSTNCRFQLRIACSDTLASSAASVTVACPDSKARMILVFSSGGMTGGLDIYDTQHRTPSSPPDLPSWNEKGPVTSMRQASVRALGRIQAHSDADMFPPCRLHESIIA